MEALFETEFDELLREEDELVDDEWEDMLDEILSEVDFDEPQGEVASNSRQKVRWIQQSLNKILGMRLKADGIMGPKTRGAIRIFQRKYRLKVDGVVGSRTEKALRNAGKVKPSSPSQQVIYPPDTINDAAARLKSFDFNSAALKPFHRTAVTRITDRIIQSWRTGKPIFTVKVIGHTDPEGSRQYNQKLGLRRALAVRKEIQNALKRKQRNLYYKVLVLASSKGETERIDFTNTPKGQAQNRRVEVFLSTKALQPIKGKVHTLDPVIIYGKTPSDPHHSPPAVPKRCRKKEWNQMINGCISDSKNCIFNGCTKNLGIDLVACKGNPVCMATATAKYWNCVSQCNNTLNSCRKRAEETTNCKEGDW